LGNFAGELIVSKVLTFQEAYQICQAEGCDRENVLKFIFSTVSKNHGDKKLHSAVAEANCDLGQFIKDGSFEKWLEVNVSC
jgi:hypothetical protein